MDIVERAINLFFLGKTKQAEKILEDLLDMRRTDPRVWFLKALIDRFNHKLKDALIAIKKATDLRKDFMEAWVLRAIIAEDLRDYEEALMAIDEAINLSLRLDDYEDYELLIEKAKILYLMGKSKEAKNILSHVQELNPEDVDMKDLLKKLE